MRGKEGEDIPLTKTKGITPAYAGKSRVLAGSRHPCEDHPRVCGEKKNIKAMCKALMGSPPRMRGKGASKLSDAKAFGITPAYAGKSRSREKR